MPNLEKKKQVQKEIDRLFYLGFAVCQLLDGRVIMDDAEESKLYQKAIKANSNEDYIICKYYRGKIVPIKESSYPRNLNLINTVKLGSKTNTSLILITKELYISYLTYCK